MSKESVKTKLHPVPVQQPILGESLATLLFEGRRYKKKKKKVKRRIKIAQEGGLEKHNHKTQ